MFKVFVIALSFFLLTNIVTAQNAEKSHIIPHEALIDPGPVLESNVHQKVKTSPSSLPDYITSTNSVGVSTGITGFFDFQTNGGALEYLEVNPLNPNRIHAIMMIAMDSLNVSTSRRTAYNYSSNAGASWGTRQILNSGPFPRSGYPQMTIKRGTGSNFLSNVVNHANHPSPDDPDNPLSTALSLQQTEGGVFSNAIYPPPGQFETSQPIWPMIKIAPNGNYVIAAGRSSGGVYATVYNPTSGLFQSWTPIDESVGGARKAMAVSPDGEIAIAWFASPGEIETYTIRYSTSNDNGLTWSDFESIEKGIDDYIYFGGFDMMYIGSTLYITSCGGKIEQGTVFYRSSRVFLWDSESRELRVAIDSTNFPKLKLTATRNQVNHDFSFHQPSISSNVDETKIYIAASAHLEGIVDSEGWHYSDIIYTQSHDGGFTWLDVRNITNTNNLDERYPSVSNFNPTIADSNRLYLVFQEDKIPGVPGSGGVGRPVSRASLKFLKVNTDLYPTIYVDPSDFYVSAPTGTTTTEIMTIYNEGVYDLNFRITADYSLLPKNKSAKTDQTLSREENHAIAKSSLQKTTPPKSKKLKDHIQKKVDYLKQNKSMIFYDDVETGQGNWTTQAITGSNLWHITDYTANSLDNSWWCGIETQGNYNNGQRIDNALISPQISLVGLPSAFLQFFEFYDTEEGYDFCMVDVTTNNGVTWIPLRGSTGSAPSGSNGDWLPSGYDLTPFAGNNIKFRFYFDTGDDAYQNYYGWFIDDIMVLNSGWLTTNPVFGTVPPGESIDLDVIFNTDGLFGGEYFANMIIRNNDPEQLFYHVPVFLEVYENASVSGIKFNDLNANGTKDAGEPGIPNWKIYISGITNDSIFTNAEGRYKFENLWPGNYTISEELKSGWLQTYPTQNAYNLLLDFSQHETDKDFGNFKYGTISGVQFDDLNGNGIKDSGEPGLQGWKIYMTGSKVDSVLTGVNGLYNFGNLNLGSYTVTDEFRIGWHQTKPVPANHYTINITQSGDSGMNRDFGKFKLGLISGKIFTDLNHNGTLDSGEPGVADMRVDLRGINPVNNQAIITTADGIYSFRSFIDEYVISAEIAPNKYFTIPSAKRYNFNVNTSGLEFIDKHFGLSWLTDSVMYRSFLPESLVSLDVKGKLPKAAKRKPRGGYWEFKLAHNKPQPIREMHIQFNVDVIKEKVTSTPSPFGTMYGEKKKLTFLSGSWQANDTIIIKGYSSKGKPQLIKKIWFGSTSVTPVTDIKPYFEYLELPMPNYDNLITEMFAANAFQSDGGLLIGTKRTDAPKNFGWVLIAKPKDVQKSLRTGLLLHTHKPKFFSHFIDMKSFIGAQKSLPPTKQNNKLFAELVALKLGITASALERTQVGFGELIYDNPGNPLHGLMVKQIFESASAAMTSRTGDSTNFYNVVRQINLAFNGKFDTSKFSQRTELKNIRYLTDVPYLRFNPEVPLERITPVENYWTEIPSAFELYQNYPNPFNPSTTIEFTLPEDAMVTLKVYNVLGQEVASLIDHELYTEGRNDVEFDAGKLSSGIYFYRLTADCLDEGSALFTQVRKMLLLK